MDYRNIREIIDKPFTVHDAIEDLQKLWDTANSRRRKNPLQFISWWNTTFEVPHTDCDVIFKSLMNSLQGAVVYDFGKIGPAPAHQEFAAQLLEHDSLIHHEEVVVLSRSLHSDHQPIMYLVSKINGGTCITIFMRSSASTIMPVCAIPFFELKVDLKNGLTEVGVRDTIMFVKAPKTGRLNANNELIPLTQNEWLGGHVCHAAGLLAMLGCREIERETIHASDKVNTRRVKAGKPKISDRIIIRLHQHVYEIDGLKTTPGSSTKSPHWRRPHKRWHYRGQRLDTPILVAPTWVNWDPLDGTAEPKRKIYEVRT